MNSIAVALKVSVTQLYEGSAADVTLSSNSIPRSNADPSFCFENCEIIDLSKNNDLGIVSPYLFGNNLEHTRSSICGGLSAQMLKNRKFVGKPSAMEGVAQGWYIIGDKTYCCFSKPYTHHDTEHYHMHRKVECNAQLITNFYAGEMSGIGQHELCLICGEVYEFAIVLRSIADISLTVSLSDRFGKKIYSETVINVHAGETWERYTAELTCNCSDCDADLRIIFEETSSVHIGAVSLMNKNNFRGMRPDVIEAMKEMGIRILRWPGGNFAGEYNWFDGLLPVDERAPFGSYLGLETQPHTLGYDLHEICTDDFVALCRLIGAEPFITINLSWNTPEENAAWVEYCNGDINTKYGKLRAEHGQPEPYNVRFWSLGNEMGYGHMEGDNSASGYSHLAMENGKKMLEVSPDLILCSSGVYPGEEWVKYSARPLSDIAKFVSLHYYSDWPNYDDSDKSKEEYEKCIASVGEARKRIHQLRKQLGDGVASISFDEWNVWYGWYRPSCVTDGVHAAMMLNMLIGEAQVSDVGIACHFEAVNESAIKVTPFGAALTATGQAIALMKEHTDGILRYADDCVVVTEKDGIMTLTAVNPLYDRLKTFLFKNGGNITCAKLYEGRSLIPHAHFEISDLDVHADGTLFKFELPPHSMSVVRYTSTEGDI